MKILKSREEILPFVCEWIELLAQDKYEEAFELLHHPGSEVWTPNLLRQLVANYGSSEPPSDGRTFRVTSPFSSIRAPANPTPYQDVEWLSDTERKQMPERVAWVHFDVPLNGEWSDLTAIFWVITFGQNYVLQLEDMHVL